MSAYLPPAPSRGPANVFRLEFQPYDMYVHDAYQEAVVDLGRNVFRAVAHNLVVDVERRPQPLGLPRSRSRAMQTTVLRCQYPGKARPPQPFFWELQPELVKDLRRNNSYKLAGMCVDSMYTVLAGTGVYDRNCDAFRGGRLPYARDRAFAILGDIIKKRSGTPRTLDRYLSDICLFGNNALRMATGGPVLPGVRFSYGRPTAAGGVEWVSDTAEYRGRRSQF